MTILVFSRGRTPSRAALSDFSGALTVRLVCQVFFPAGLYSEGSLLLIVAFLVLVTASRLNKGLWETLGHPGSTVLAEKKICTPDLPLLNNVTGEELFAAR